MVGLIPGSSISLPQAVVSLLARIGRRFYCRRMKRFSLLMVGLALATVPPTASAQDAATEERLNKLNGLVQDLVEDKANMKKQLDAMAKEVQSLREQSSNASGAANAEDLKRLAEQVREIDRKRVDDNERIMKALDELKKTLVSQRSKPPTAAAANTGSSGGGGAPAEKGYEYIVQSGDTLSAIATAYKEQGVKVTADDILKANPGLKATSLTVGKKIFIPAPAK